MRCLKEFDRREKREESREREERGIERGRDKSGGPLRASAVADQVK